MSGHSVKTRNDKPDFMDIRCVCSGVDKDASVDGDPGIVVSWANVSTGVDAVSTTAGATATDFSSPGADFGAGVS